uniref:Uncharacterized protein n=1 Tax=Lotharella oceanica TaxID=641309 RepID=A0A7S2U298_9EUKA
MAAQIKNLEDQAGKMLTRKEEQLVAAKRRATELEDALSMLKKACERQALRHVEVKAQLEEAKQQNIEQAQCLEEQADLLEKEKVAIKVLEGKLVELRTGERAGIRLAEERADREAEAVKQLTVQIERMTNQHAEDVKLCKRKHVKELDMIHKKIRKVIKSKDSQIRTWKSMAEKLQLKVVKLEQYLLAQKDNLTST